MASARPRLDLHFAAQFRLLREIIGPSRLTSSLP
jgi:hypothetical protein